MSISGSLYASLGHPNIAYAPHPSGTFHHRPQPANMYSDPRAVAKGLVSEAAVTIHAARGPFGIDNGNGTALQAQRYAAAPLGGDPTIASLNGAARVVSPARLGQIAAHTHSSAAKMSTAIASSADARAHAIPSHSPRGRDDRSPHLPHSQQFVAMATAQGARREREQQQRTAAVRNAFLRSRLRAVGREMEEALEQWEAVVGPLAAAAATAHCARAEVAGAKATQTAQGPHANVEAQTPPKRNQIIVEDAAAGNTALPPNGLAASNSHGNAAARDESARKAERYVEFSPTREAASATREGAVGVAVAATPLPASRPLFTSPSTPLAASAAGHSSPPTTQGRHRSPQRGYDKKVHSSDYRGERAQPTSGAESASASEAFALPPQLALARGVLEQLAADEAHLVAALAASEANTARMRADAAKMRADRRRRQDALEELTRQQRLLEAALGANDVGDNIASAQNGGQSKGSSDANNGRYAQQQQQHQMYSVDINASRQTNDEEEGACSDDVFGEPHNSYPRLHKKGTPNSSAAASNGLFTTAASVDVSALTDTLNNTAATAIATAAAASPERDRSAWGGRTSPEEGRGTTAVEEAEGNGEAMSPPPSADSVRRMRRQQQQQRDERADLDLLRTLMGPWLDACIGFGEGNNKKNDSRRQDDDDDRGSSVEGEQAAGPVVPPARIGEWLKVRREIRALERALPKRRQLLFEASEAKKRAQIAKKEERAEKRLQKEAEDRQKREDEEAEAEAEAELQRLRQDIHHTSERIHYLLRTKGALAAEAARQEARQESLAAAFKTEAVRLFEAKVRVGIDPEAHPTTAATTAAASAEGNSDYRSKKVPAPDGRPSTISSGGGGDRILVHSNNGIVADPHAQHHTAKSMMKRDGGGRTPSPPFVSADVSAISYRSPQATPTRGDGPRRGAAERYSYMRHGDHAAAATAPLFSPTNTKANERAKAADDSRHPADRHSRSANAASMDTSAHKNESSPHRSAVSEHLSDAASRSLHQQGADDDSKGQLFGALSQLNALGAEGDSSRAVRTASSRGGRSGISKPAMDSGAPNHHQQPHDRTKPYAALPTATLEAQLEAHLRELTRIKAELLNRSAE